MTKDGIEQDLKNEKPQWPFSAYGPGRDAPTQLFGGFPLEQSPEEMRVLYYKALANGNPQPAVSAMVIDIVTHGRLTLHTDPSRAGTSDANNATSRTDSWRSSRGREIRLGWREPTSKPHRRMPGFCGECFPQRSKAELEILS